MAFQESDTLYYHDHAVCVHAAVCMHVYWPYIHGFLHLYNVSEPFYW